jgi:hypothetical protein
VLFALQSEIGPIIVVDDDESGPEIRDTLYTCTCSTCQWAVQFLSRESLNVALDVDLQ